MCGIIGFVERSTGRDSLRDTVGMMAKEISYRGPDDEGIWTDDVARVALAHRRLSIVDLSPAGHQPMMSADQRYVMIFNGEVYNYEELRNDLNSNDPVNWRGHSDTEVLLEAIRRWGVTIAVTRCVGMFAFAVWDRITETLTIARDRLGEKPVYYGDIGNSFAFASELKALQQHPAWVNTIDRGSLALMMRRGYVPAPYSIFQNIQKLEAGHILVFNKKEKKPKLSQYWSARDASAKRLTSPFIGTAQEAVETTDKLMRQALRGQMLADVPIGAFLSGGIDSSTIVAIMQSISSRPIRTFTIGFSEQGYNEAVHAKKVAEHLGTDHCELYVSDRDAQNVVPLLSQIYCEPFADSSQIPTYLVAKLARQDVTVALSGDGGDELFSGYNRYGLAYDLWQKLAIVPDRLRALASRLLTVPSPSIYDSLLAPLLKLLSDRRRLSLVGDKIHKAASLLPAKSIEDIYLRLCSHWTELDDLVIGGSEHSTLLTNGEKFDDIPGAIERMMYVDTVSYLPDDILAKVDRAAMAVSLETRVPFLDHRVVEFAMSLPLDILRAAKTSKWPLRQLLYRYVPQNLVDRPKMGFGVPIESWLRGPLREWAESQLNENRLKQEGYFNHKLVRQRWDDHLSGRRNYQYPIWNVLMFQAWLEQQSLYRSRI